jgi:hypothetical protein
VARWKKEEGEKEDKERQGLKRGKKEREIG